METNSKTIKFLLAVIGVLSVLIVVCLFRAGLLSQESQTPQPVVQSVPAFNYKAAAEREIAKQASDFAAAEKAKQAKVVAKALKFIKEANKDMEMMLDQDRFAGVQLSAAEKKLEVAKANNASPSLIEALELEVDSLFSHFEATGHSIHMQSTVNTMRFSELFEGKLSESVYTELLSKLNPGF